MNNKKFFSKAFGGEFDFIARFFLKENEGVFKTFLGIILKSFLVAITSATIWLYTFWNWHIQANPIHAEIMNLVMHIIIIGFYIACLYKALDLAIQKYHKMIDCCHEIDKEKAKNDYKKIRKHFPLMIHLLTSLSGFGLMVIVMLSPYESSEFGFWVVFITMFGLYAFFKGCLHLEDPTSGIWPLVKLPEGLME